MSETKAIRFLYIIILLSVVGLELELLLIGHVEEFWQILPVIMLPLTLLVLLAHEIILKRGMFRVSYFYMVMMLGTGIFGTFLHYQNNSLFEQEMYPHLSGFKLMKESLTGAIPVLAPGGMISIGLCGILLLYLKQNTNKENE